MEAALAQGRGAIAIAAHAGNWEYTVMGYGLLCRPGVVVGRELDQPWAARLARYIRQRGGNSMVAKQKGMKGIMGYLQQNWPVGIVIDQNTTTAGGLLVDFFGHPARTTPVAALLARRGVPGSAHPSRRLPDGRHLMVILPPLPLTKTADPHAASSAIWNSRAGSSRPGSGRARNSGSGSTGAGRTSFRRFILGV